MEAMELNSLEEQVDQLLSALQRLKYENASLKQKLNQNAKEQRLLQEKNQKAAAQIKQVINQLKDEIA